MANTCHFAFTHLSMVSSFQFEVSVFITLLKHCGIRFARDVPFHETKYQVISSVEYGEQKSSLLIIKDQELSRHGHSWKQIVTTVQYFHGCRFDKTKQVCEQRRQKIQTLLTPTALRVQIKNTVLTYILLHTFIVIKQRTLSYAMNTFLWNITLHKYLFLSFSLKKLNKHIEREKRRFVIVYMIAVNAWVTSWKRKQNAKTYINGPFTES